MSGPFDVAPAAGPQDDRPHEACGVFAVHAKGADVARLTFFALYALQHRGQESAGIATCAHGVAHVHKGMGLVTQVFKEEHLVPLVGDRAIGHTRYATTGASHERNAQPFLLHTTHGPLGVAHNGNLTNAAALRRELLAKGVGLVGESDTEVIAQLLAAPTAATGADWEGRIARFMAVAEGAYSLVILTPGAIFAVRDGQGYRPLCLGELRTAQGPGWAVASESAALGTVGGRFVREIAPGEVVRIDDAGVTAWRPPLPARPVALCVFEYVYFARPDTRLEGQMVHQVRQRLGRELAREAPCVGADLVMPVPDSSVAAAIGYARESGLPYNEGLIKNRYIGRTFIAPTDEQRRSGVRLKFNAIDQNLVGRKVVMVDDSIVRGNTAGKIVAMLREAGAREVHVRVSSPPVRHPCFMGVDMATYEELIGHRLDVGAIRAHLGADSLAYLSHEGLMRAVTEGVTEGPCGHCSACFTGRYPLVLPPRAQRA